MQIKVLECRKFSSTAPIIPHPRTVCDYEIDLEIGEPRTMVIDGVSTIVKRGDVSVRFPGQQVYSIGAQSSILLTVDFSGKNILIHTAAQRLNGIKNRYIAFEFFFSAI